MRDYRDAREAYWSDTDHEDIVRRAYDEIALMFMKVVTTLVTGSVEPGGDDWREENENRWTWFLKQLEQHDEVAILFDQAIEMRVYESVMERLEGSRERCLQLASLRSLDSTQRARGAVSWPVECLLHQWTSSRMCDPLPGPPRERCFGRLPEARSPPSAK
jgi:hypothetical protein